MNKKVMKSAALFVIAASVVLGGISVFAENAKPAVGEPKSVFAGGRMKGAGFGNMQIPEGETEGIGMKANVRGFIGFNCDEAVANGIISQETADKITSYMEAQAEAMKAEMDKMKEMPAEERKALFDGTTRERKDMLEELIGAGIITQSEADALKAAMPSFEAWQGARGFRGFNLESLVESGIIDQETADQVEAYMLKKAEAMKAEMESRSEEMKTKLESRSEEMKSQMEAIKNMTEEERKAFFESVKNERIKDAPPEGMMKMEEPVDIISELVNEGILTQSQADAIKELMPKRADRPEKPAVEASSNM